MMARGASTLRTSQAIPEGTVTMGPVLDRKLVHFALNEPTVRKNVKTFLEKRSDKWERALNVSSPFSELEKAWRELVDELRFWCGLPFVWLAAVGPECLEESGECSENKPAELDVDLCVFRRIYYDYVLGFPCVKPCTDLELDRCGEALERLMKRRFQETPGMGDTSHRNATWQGLRGLNFRAFALLCCMQTVLFLTDIAGSQVGQERVSVALGTCQSRLLHMVNTGVDDVSLNAEKLYVVCSS